MARVDNYALQAKSAMEYFLRYDQEKLIRKLNLQADAQYLYAEMLCRMYRISRTTGSLQRLDGEHWAEANTHGEVMTLLDLVCDSREDRFVTGRWESMATFGMKIHQNLLEDRADPFAQAVQENIPAFMKACEMLRGQQIPGADVSFQVDFFDGMSIGIQFWAGDEEFSPRVRFLWDANALMYLKYETMYFAIGMLKNRIMEEMKNLAAN